MYEYENIMNSGMGIFWIGLIIALVGGGMKDMEIVIIGLSILGFSALIIFFSFYKASSGGKIKRVKYIK